MIDLTMMIFIKKGKEEIFHQYEELVIPILEEHGAMLIYRIRPTPENFLTAEEELPYEIHFISFESELDFTDFTNDNRRREFLYLKEDSIKASFLVKGKKI